MSKSEREKPQTEEETERLTSGPTSHSTSDDKKEDAAPCLPTLASVADKICSFFRGVKVPSVLKKPGGVLDKEMAEYQQVSQHDSDAGKSKESDKTSAAAKSSRKSPFG